MSWKSVVTRIKSSDSVAADVVNTPLSQLAERTDYLKAVMENMTASEFNYLSNIPISAALEVGQAVYWDSGNRRFGPALARWSDDLSDYGSLLPAESAYFSGILVSRHTGETGSVIISGYISNFHNIEDLFGEASPEAGVYYVSAEKPGVLTKDAPPMTVPAVMYDGAGNVIMLPTGSIVSQHDHRQYRLSSAFWIPATPENFPGMDIPAGANWGYDRENAPEELDSLFTLYTGTGSFLLEDAGTILNNTYIELNDDNIWIKDTTPPLEDVLAHIAYPDAHGPNIVRGVTTDTPEYFSFSVSNGLMTANMKEATLDAADDDSMYALKEIENNTQKKGPVVTVLQQGEGIIVTSQDGEGHGHCTVALESAVDVINDADIINLNNAIQRTDGGLLYSVFPADRESSMSLVANTGKWGGAERRLKIRMWIRGVQGQVLPAFDLRIFVFPPASSGGTSIPSEIPLSIPAGSVITDSDKYYLVEKDAEASISVQSGSQIQYIVEPSATPSEDILVLRHGITTYIPGN